LAIPVQPLEEGSVVAIGLEHDLAVMASIHPMTIGRPRAVPLAGYTRHGFPQLAVSPNVLLSPLWTRFIPKAVAGKVCQKASPLPKRPLPPRSLPRFHWVSVLMQEAVLFRSIPCHSVSFRVMWSELPASARAST
jgi:hypothetical protein